ncbi:MAG: DUF1440 domain-containing protein [Acidobacteriota bacterium]
MSEIESERSLVKGLVAGLVAGLAATAAQAAVEIIYPPRHAEEPTWDEAPAEKQAGLGLEPSQPRRTNKTIRWGVGALAGAAYGALAEFYPAATQEQGAIFGLALMILTEETVPSNFEAFQEQAGRAPGGDSSSHIVSGMVAERVRSVLRRML